MGLAERRVGLALAAHPREACILQTKVGYHLRPLPSSAAAGGGGRDVHSSGGGGGHFFMEFDYSAAGVARQLEDSLQRLGVSRVDSLVIHGMDHAAAQARARATASHADPDEAEEAVLAQLEGPEGGLACLLRLRAGGRVRAVGAALNEECPVHPHDEAKRELPSSP